MRKFCKPLTGLHCLITAGPTREYLDPVRFLSNPSSGKMGYALAEEALRRGAKVTLVSGPVGAQQAAPLRIIPVVSAQEMYDVVMREARQADVIIMAAAVSDWRPVRSASRKIKKRPGPMTLRLVRTPDILATLGKMKRNWQRAQQAAPLLVGFAAETDHLLRNACRKLKRKNLDLIVANRVGTKKGGFESDKNEVWLVERSGKKSKSELISKQRIAKIILGKIYHLLSK